MRLNGCSHSGRLTIRFDQAQALDLELKSLAADERSGLVHFLRRLDLLDRERAYAELACGSTFEYLVKEMHYAEGTAWRRVNAMQLVRSFPQLEVALGEGRLNLTTLGTIGKLLTPDNVDDLVRRATHLTKRQAEELAVSLQPRNVAQDGLRRLPSRPVERAPSETLDLAPTPVTGVPELIPDMSFPPVEMGGQDMASVSAPPPQPRMPERPRLEPVAASRWQWRITLDGERKTKLEALADLLSHKFPDRDLDQVFDQMLADSLEKHGKRRGTVKPFRRRATKPLPAPTPGRRARIATATRREVFERDGHRCTFESADGRRCESTHQLELDHVDPAAETGSSRPEDLTVRCRAHNLLRAIRRYGLAYVERRIAEARRERRALDLTRPRTLEEPGSELGRLGSGTDGLPPATSMSR